MFGAFCIFLGWCEVLINHAVGVRDGISEEVPRCPHCGLGFRVSAPALLEGSWDLVTTYNWAYNPSYTPPSMALKGLPQL